MNYKIALRIAVLLSILIGLIGCQAWQPASSDLTPAEQTLMKFEAAFIQQYQDTMSMAKQPNLTPAQKEIVVKKKALLIKVKPLIDAYGMVVMSGGKPTAAQEQAIYDIMNQLGTKL